MSRKSGSRPPDDTTYTYNVLDKLAGVTQGSQTRTFVYDAFGFLRSETTPEKGTVSYTSYDALGDVLSETQNDNTSRTRVYDAAGRLCKLTAGTGSGSDFLLSFYDGLAVCGTVADPTPPPSWSGGTYPQGKLTRRLGYNPGGSPQLLVRDEFAYTTNTAGRLSSQTTYFNTGVLASAPQSWVYNSLGLVVQHAHARSSGPPFIVNTLYNQGLPVTEYANGMPLVTATYQPSGALATYTTGPGIGRNVVTTISQNANGIPRPSQITAIPVGAGVLFDTGTFAYDGAGNITAMGPDVFTYDARSRLCSAALSGIGTQYYGYDRFGNLITKGASSTACASSTSWANNRVPAATYAGSPGLRGDLTAYAGTSYNFDSIDRLTGTVTPAWSYLFDGASERIVKALPGSDWTYTFRDEGKRVSTEYVGSSPLAISRDNLYLGNLLVASLANPAVQVNGPVWTFYSSDHLGTPRLVTYADGSQVETRRHWPYGDDIGTVSAFERVRFASMERDTEDSTYHDHARHQEFNLGRFLSPDKVMGNAGNAQSWNRYAYAMNNPEKFVDQNGKWPAYVKEIHQAAIDRALPSVPVPDRQILKSQQRSIDLHQSSSVAFQHAMRSSSGQSVDAARGLSNKFVHDNLVLAIGAQRAGDHEAAMRYLGNAMHTLQDATSPAHQGFQVDGAEGAIAHAMKERHDPGAGSSLDEATRRAWDYFTGKLPLPKDFFPETQGAPTGGCKDANQSGCEPAKQ